MPKQLLPVPEFKDEDEEIEFWSSHDTSDYVDWSKAERISFPNLKSTDDIDLKWKELLVMRDIERLAKQQHVSKRALIVQYLSDAIKRNGDVQQAAG